MISIIIPVYNAEKYLDQCFRSVLAQNYSNIEIIVVDDGSCDMSGAICDAYAAADPRVKVFHKENGGVSSARNYGLDKAEGEWIGWVDADDYISKDMYKELYEAIVTSNADIAYCGYKANNNRSQMPTNIMDKAEFINQYLLVQTNSLCVTLCKRELYYKNRICFNEENCFGEDLLVTTKLYYHAAKIIQVPSDLYYYRENQESICNSQMTHKKIEELLNNILELDSFLRHTELYDKIRERIACRILSVKRYYLEQKEFIKWYSICPWTHKYISKSHFTGIKGKIQEYIVACICHIYSHCKIIHKKCLAKFQL